MDGMAWPPPSRRRTPLSAARALIRALRPGESVLVPAPPGACLLRFQRTVARHAWNELGAGMVATRQEPEEGGVRVWRHPWR